MACGQTGTCSRRQALRKAATQQLQLTYTHIFNQNLIAVFKAGYTRINIQSGSQDIGLGADAKLGFPQQGNYDTPGLLNFGMTALFMSNIILGDSPGQPVYNRRNIYQYLGTVSYTRGSHNLKFGVGLVPRQVQFVQTSFPMGSFMLRGSPGGGV